MRLKRFAVVLLSCMMMLSLAAIPVSAASVPGDSTVIMRAGGRLDHSIAAKTIVTVDSAFNLEKGDTVKFDCSYTPKSASVDFGVIAPDGLFYALNTTSGSITKSLKVEESGQYTLAIRNNASYSITVTGTIKY